MRTSRLLALCLLLPTGCSEDPPPSQPGGDGADGVDGVDGADGADTGTTGPDPAEWLPGGDTTNTLLLGNNAFLMPAQNLSDDHEQDFYSGNSFFNASWVEAPASTAARDGLGPLFHARTCSGCHFRDGKGAPPEDGLPPFVGLLLRIGVPGPDGTVPDPVYGGQLQDQANPGVPVEAAPVISWTDLPRDYPDGTPVTLSAPIYTITEPAHGPLPDDLQVSPRIAPHMIGLGLLEQVPEARLGELADPDDADGDGISGRIQRHADGRVGRFGWKGDAATVEDQVAGAFLGDMGLASRLQPVDDCTAFQEVCQSEPDGGTPEVEDHILDLVVLYSRAVAVPVRRAADDPTVLSGRQLFRDIGCADCHTPEHRTGPGPLDEFDDQRIFPYTDLLLHDMGPELADNKPVEDASGREWQTPPLWGLGLVDEVGGHTRFLHDGRARSLEEAILWHGGEGETARVAFQELSVDDRAAVLAFVEDL